MPLAGETALRHEAVSDVAAKFSGAAFCVREWVATEAGCLPTFPTRMTLFTLFGIFLLLRIAFVKNGKHKGGLHDLPHRKVTKIKCEQVMTEESISCA